MRLHNQFLDLMTDQARGDMIVSFREKGQPNVIDADDQGRGIQSSWYGVDNYGSWAGQPWPWNPIQGGGYQAAQFIRAEREIADDGIASSGWADWSTGRTNGVVKMITHLRLDGPVLTRSSIIKYVPPRLRGTHPRHQEEPAIFCLPQYKFVVTGGGLKTLLAPGANQYGPVQNGWLGLVRKDGYGIYLTTSAPEWTGYTRDGAMSCAYVAPIRTYALGESARYSNTLTVGGRTTAFKRLGITNEQHR